MAGLGAGAGAEMRGAGAGTGVPRARGPVGAVATRLATALGTAAPRAQDWLTLTPRDRMPAPNHVAFPKPPKAPGMWNVEINSLLL